MPGTAACSGSHAAAMTPAANKTQNIRRSMRGNRRYLLSGRRSLVGLHLSGSALHCAWRSFIFAFISSQRCGFCLQCSSQPCLPFFTAFFGIGFALRLPLLHLRFHFFAALRILFAGTRQSALFFPRDIFRDQRRTALAALSSWLSSARTAADWPCKRSAMDPLPESASPACATTEELESE